MSIAENYKEVRAQVEDECRRCGRNPEEVVLLAVSKTTDALGVDEARSAGAQDFGENRPDQLVEKFGAFPQLRWHFIGNIQSRRIRDIVPAAELIHSLYKPEHAVKINDDALAIGKVQQVLLEVNVSGEESKSGIAPDQLPDMLGAVLALPNVKVRGLMTMAPQGDLAVAQECFADLRKLAQSERAKMPADAAAAFDQLSMGMSEDWRQAIAEGSTIVRIGRAIFSDDFGR